MSPAPGEILLRFVGDRITFRIRSDRPFAQGFLRTNLGRASFLHAEIVQAYHHELSRWNLAGTSEPIANLPAGMAWRDIPMARTEGGWQVELTLTEVGFFNAKAYVLDEHHRQVWPPGPDLAITVHPGEYRCGNTIYCAFPRMFGETKSALAIGRSFEVLIERLDKQQYAVIPPSGKLRDLIREFPHIFGTLGCRVLQLLPVNPTPTTYARFGRFGSPYAAQDLTLIDPALVEFDRRSTGVEQFQELTYEAHARGGRVLLDMVINHTGWGSTLQENHPEWFLRKENGQFVSPGAWGTTWEDLIELNHGIPVSWDHLAEAFITWCRRGVDGFRCDAGYKVPTAAWRYIIARVRHEFPKALFLLEGLGGAWEATEELLTRGGMQWAYSELFQNYNPSQVSGYLDHSVLKSSTAGTLVHFSETHDNDRLAARGRAWSLLRNQLCALASDLGAYGYTCGVEWLAAEKINVHSSRGMAWGNADNIIPELARLARLLSEHPAFFDGAKVRRVSGVDSPVLALDRLSADQQDRILALVNLDSESRNSFFISSKAFQDLGEPKFDLLTDTHIKVDIRGENVELRLGPGQSLCLARDKKIRGPAGPEYRKRRAQHSFAIAALGSFIEPEEISPHNWIELAQLVESDVKRFLAVVSARGQKASHASGTEVDAPGDLMATLAAPLTALYPAVVEWTLLDQRRVTPIPPRHWLLITDAAPFRATLSIGSQQQHAESIELAGGHAAVFAPVDAFKRARSGKAHLSLERFGVEPRHASAQLLFLRPKPEYSAELALPLDPGGGRLDSPLVLLTNGRGGMARICVDLGRVKSKYDCVLGANLHPEIPVDRHVFVKRLRLWANADRFITPLNGANLQSFHPGPPVRWEFAAIAGDGKFARIELLADMLEEKNTTVFSIRLLDTSKPGSTVRVTARFDLEDRNFHTQTHHNGGADHHFSTHTHVLQNRTGFEFSPPGDRQVRIYSTQGQYHSSPEWSYQLPHIIEQTRGQHSSGDAFSPGWFDLALEREVPVFLTVTADAEIPPAEIVTSFAEERRRRNQLALNDVDLPDSFGRQLALAARAFVVRRNECKTIIAGYPWFLDWGRDSLICARGLIAAGMLEEVRQLLITFGRFEKDGTLPNTIHGEDAANRDTSDAPLWYGVVCEELAAATSPELYQVPVDPSGRTIRDVLQSIATGYICGTPNGIAMDPASALIWSPSHFTWMDTNYPAGTPRQGYPIEIQALWIKLLEQLDRLGLSSEAAPWSGLAATARASLNQLFWLEHKGWLADVLISERHTPAAQANADDALRSNCVIPISLGLIAGPRARRCMENVLRYLFVPGALRSLAPLPLSIPLPIYGSDWRLLNDPHKPYWGRYEGDEDTQRKPAYHNGTAWTWTFPAACEAIARAWDFSAQAVDSAKAYLGSMDALLANGCLGQIPEIIDGDAPHTERGCDAQSWSVTEALRVWKLLNR